MSVKPDRKYDGTIGAGAHMVVSQGGTLGFQFTIECEDGEIIHTIWLTPNTREFAEKDFATLGVKLEQLRDEGYVEYKLAADIQGRGVSFTTISETYKDKTRTKVGFINKRGTVASGGSPAGAAAAFFGGKPKPVNIPQQTVVRDEDIPF